MKKLLIAFLLISTMAKSQETYFLAIGFDPKMAIKGSYDYDKTPSLDVSFNTGIRFKNNFEFYMGAEYAQLNPYYLAFTANVDYTITTWNEKWTFSTGPEILMIDRGRFNGMEKINPVYTFGWTATTSHNINENISIRLSCSLIHREDLKEMYNYKTFLNPNGKIEIRFSKVRW